MEEKRLMATKITDATPQPETPKVENVGEEFMAWAERGWALEKIITNGLKNDEGGESCPYDYLRRVFVEKINELSKNQK